MGEGLLQRAERRSSWRRWHLNWAWKDKEGFTRQKWEGRESLAEETAWTGVGGGKEERRGKNPPRLGNDRWPFLAGP